MISHVHFRFWFHRAPVFERVRFGVHSRGFCRLIGVFILPDNFSDLHLTQRIDQIWWWKSSTIQIRHLIKVTYIYIYFHSFSKQKAETTTRNPTPVSSYDVLHYSHLFAFHSHPRYLWYVIIVHAGTNGHFATCIWVLPRICFWFWFLRLAKMSFLGK